MRLAARFAGVERPVAVDDHGDAERLAVFGSSLAEGIAAALGPWVVRSVVSVADRWSPGLGADLAGPAERAASAAVAAVIPRIRSLLSSDADVQQASPLALLRGAVRYPTEVLAAAGVPAVMRDSFAEQAFPDDVYDLAPATFADLDPELRDVGLAWGAAKAHVVLSRRRAEGLR